MKKSMIVIDTPICCGECYLFIYKAEEIPIGDYAYQKLFRCKLEPEGLCEDDGDIVYLNNFIYDGKPPWCPLKELPEGEITSDDQSFWDRFSTEHMSHYEIGDIFKESEE